MSPSNPILPECAALAQLLQLRKIRKAALADELQISESQLSRYLTSLLPPPELVDLLLEKAGFERADYEDLVSSCARVLGQRTNLEGPASPVDPTPAESNDIHARAAVIGREAEQRSVDRQVEIVRVHKTNQARAEAETLCALLEQDPKPCLAVETVRDLQTWSVAERLVQRSLELASDRPDRAMELGALAYRVAALAPCEGPFRQSLLGSTLLYWGNATRAAGDIPTARALVLKGKPLWDAGVGARGPLVEWRTLTLEGSLLRDELRFPDSLDRLDAALAVAPQEEKAGILLTKSCTLEQMGKPKKALGVLQQAERIVDRQQDAWLFLALQINRATALWRLGLHGKAAVAIPELRSLATQLGREPIEIRVTWLEARLAAGLKNWEEAEAAFQKVRRHFMRRQTAWDCAQASLELAELLCRQRRSREALSLFEELGIRGEAMAAVRQLCEVAERSAVPRKLTERVLLLLQAPARQLPSPTGGATDPWQLPPGSRMQPPSGDSLPAGGSGRPVADVQTAVTQATSWSMRPAGSCGVPRPAARTGEAMTSTTRATTQAARLCRTTERDDMRAAPPGSDPGASSPGRGGRPVPENTGAERGFVRSPDIHPEDFRVLVGIFLVLRDWSQEDLAEASGYSKTTIWNYVNGTATRRIPRNRMVHLARAAGVELELVDLFLLPAIVAKREAGGRAQDDRIADLVQRFSVELQGLAAHLVFPLRQETERPGGTRPWPPAEVLREQARDLWRRLEGCEEADRWRFVETWSEYRHPGLAELLCHESETAASDRADRALELAKLAHRIAELVPGEEGEKKRLQGYTGIYFGNADRVGGELLLARRRFDEALASWKAGEGSAPFLAEWRVLDREASLLRDERRFDLALPNLTKALEIAPPEFTGRILLSKSAVHEQTGDGERAFEELRKAEPLIDRESEPRLFLILRFNTAAALCLLDRFEEAEVLYPEIQELAASLQKELDNVRLKWLAGRIGAGRGRLDEAAAALDEVRRAFTEKPSPWDCSLVTLELATVRLRQGRTAEVRTLAEELVWVFETQGIHQEALAALALFQEAAQRDAATADLTDRIVRYLRKAQGDPELRF